MRIRVSLLRELKYSLRAAFGRPKRSKRPAPMLVTRRLELDRDIDPKSLRFAAPEGKPEVSVVIPCYGQVEHTLNCLKSLCVNLPRCAHEILVVEDASGDPDVARLREVAGIRLIENPGNLGFLLSCNAAAQQAQGEYLLFLNNDTIVGENAIDELVEFARDHPDAGLVGSRLLYPDGHLQEAGGILWADGSAWNYGRLDDPGKPQYNYVREADYISGAAILTPRAFWDRLGGFDPVFAPAYYEDTDYAFRVRGAGLKVYYLPTSSVTHFEGATHGTDVTAGGKAHQVVNGRKFHERYGELLAREHFANATHLMRARDRAWGRRIVLIVDHFTPEPDRDAGSRTMMELIRTLQSMGSLVKFWPENRSFHANYTPLLQRIGVEVLYGPYVTSLDDWLKENGEDIDLVVLSRPRVAKAALEAVRKRTRAPVVYYGHDFHFSRQQREAEVMNMPEKAKGASKLFELERSLWRDADATIYLSQDEVDEVAKLEPRSAAFAVPGYGFDRIVERKQATQGARLLFVAGFAHPPNVDAAVWLAKEIFPLIAQARPDVTLALVGSSPTAEVLALAGARIEVTGWISSQDLVARYAEARVALVPLRFGAGVKLKAVEALSEGVPLVTTPVGAQGLPGLSDVASVCQDADAIVSATLRWLEASDEDWLAASHDGAGFVARHFGRAAMRAPLQRAIDAAETAYRRRGLPARAAS